VPRHARVSAGGRLRNAGCETCPDMSASAGTYIDRKCPFTGNVSIRGRIMAGTVKSTKMTRTIIVRRNYFHYIPKYQRYGSCALCALLIAMMAFCLPVPVAPLVHVGAGRLQYMQQKQTHRVLGRLDQLVSWCGGRALGGDSLCTISFSACASADRCMECHTSSCSCAHEKLCCDRAANFRDQPLTLSYLVN
jgi:hypothetical protein